MPTYRPLTKKEIQDIQKSGVDPTRLGIVYFSPEEVEETRKQLSMYDPRLIRIETGARDYGMPLGARERRM